MWSETGLVDGKKKASTPGVLSAESGLRRRVRRARRRQKAAVRHEACVALVGALTGLFRQTTAGHGTAEPGWLGQARTLVCNRTERSTRTRTEQNTGTLPRHRQVTEYSGHAYVRGGPGRAL